MNVQHHPTLSCASTGSPAGRKAWIDVGRGEKHLPHGQTGCHSSAKKCRVRTVCCREQTPPSWCLLARGGGPLCIVCHAGEAKGKTGEGSVWCKILREPQSQGRSYRKLEI